jgi:predicted anti-sigma-YlaC factor YlaD
VKCRDVILEFSSYLDGDLGREVIADLELHLSRCEDCRVVVDTVRKTVEIYCKAEPVPLPEDIRTRLHDALVKRCGRKPASEV